MQSPVLRGLGGLALLSLMVMGTGCTSGENSDPSSGGGVEHPIEARIPSHEQAVSVTKEHTLADLSDSPEALKTLTAFLDDPSAVDTTRIDVLVEESRRVEIASVPPNRLVLLAENPENRLYEHNVQAGTTTQIADKGNGPGQLKYAKSVARGDTSIYVARQDRRIDRFDCLDAPCTYRETTRLQFSPMAVTATTSHLTVTGMPVLNRKGMKMEDWSESGAVQMLAADGSIRRTFGRTYQANHHLVLSAYTRGSSLIYSESLKEFVRASENLPLIWTYSADGTQRSTWRIAKFDPLPFKYFPSERRLHMERAGYSKLRLQGLIEGRFVIATVQHTGVSSTESDLAGVDYYALDLETEDTYYLGRDTPREGVVDRLLLTTDEHQVLIENGRVAVVHGD